MHIHKPNLQQRLHKTSLHIHTQSLFCTQVELLVISVVRLHIEFAKIKGGGYAVTEIPDVLFRNLNKKNDF